MNLVRDSSVGFSPFNSLFYFGTQQTEPQFRLSRGADVSALTGGLDFSSHGGPMFLLSWGGSVSALMGGGGLVPALLLLRSSTNAFLC